MGSARARAITRLILGIAQIFVAALTVVLWFASGMNAVVLTGVGLTLVLVIISRLLGRSQGDDHDHRLAH